MRAADPTPELVELRQAELVRAVDDDGVRGGDVDAGLDDGGAQQNVGAAALSGATILDSIHSKRRDP
jgi:hypothetical protein